MIRTMLIAACMSAVLAIGQAKAATYQWNFEDVLGSGTVNGLLHLADDNDGTFSASSVTVTSDPSGFLNSELTELALGANFAETSTLNTFTVSGGEIVDALFASIVPVSDPGASGPDSGVTLIFNPAFNAGIGTPSLLSNVGRTDNAFFPALPTFTRVSAVPLPASLWLLLSALAGFSLIARLRPRRTEALQPA